MLKDENYVLSNGVVIPKIGFGTWQIKDGQEVYDSVTWALQAGYRHIDTAYDYRNEIGVGKAIRDFNINREEIFITTKLPSNIKTYDEAMECFNFSLKDLGVSYIDLYLIHAPWPWSNVGQDCSQGNVEVWKAMIKLYEENKIRSIGVSNFQPADIQNLIDHTDFAPHVNQIRFFIGNTQEHIVKYCAEKDILIEAYSPFATGNILQHPLLVEMANKYNVSVPKLCLRYCLNRGTLPLPKSVTKERIFDNIDNHFDISTEDMVILNEFETSAELKRKLRS